RCAAKSACTSQSSEEIIQVPAHQFKTEHLIASRFRADDAAHVTGIISIWIQPELGTVAGFSLWEKELLRHAPAASRAQAIRQQVASRTRNCADNVTASRMAQFVKQTSHLGIYTSRLRTLSALSSMNCRRGSTTSPIRIVNILSASTALSSLRSTFKSLRFSG